VQLSAKKKNKKNSASRKDELLSHLVVGAGWQRRQQIAGFEFLTTLTRSIDIDLIEHWPNNRCFWNAKLYLEGVTKEWINRDDSIK